MKFKIYTLGCKVNLYESNVMMDLLKNEGYHETNDIADIYIINTCSVTNTADNKSLKLVKRAIKENKDALIIVCGCMSQVETEKLKELEDVNIIIGNVNKSKIVDYIKNYKSKLIDIKDISNYKEFENMSLNNFNKTRAFVKIEDGCENFCSYCIIPYTRGPVRSKKKEDVLEEVKSLINNGHKEIVLTGIHTGHYGFDDYSFSDLLLDLVKIDGLKRLRISSIEITEINDNVLEVIKNNNILVDHMHIPLQSGCDKILKLMNRKYDKDYFINKIETIRNIRPNMSITTDVIVGFPDETEEDFEETIKTIEKINFSKLHVFPYSKRKGTKAAIMENQVPENIKKERVKKLLEISKKLEIDYFSKFINKEVTFIPETYKDGYIYGHTGNYLLVKKLGSETDLNNEQKVLIIDVNYPYVISK